jgi:hypothetical protein
LPRTPNSVEDRPEARGGRRTRVAAESQPPASRTFVASASLATPAAPER